MACRAAAVRGPARPPTCFVRCFLRLLSLLSLQRLPGHKDSCLTCVALVDEEESKAGLTSRLFSSGLDGALVEWDVEQGRAGPAADSLGGAVWQLAPEPGACIKPGTPPCPKSCLSAAAFLHCTPATCGVTARLLHCTTSGPS